MESSSKANDCSCVTVPNAASSGVTANIGDVDNSIVDVEHIAMSSVTDTGKRAELREG